MLGTDDIKKLAKLARITLTKEEEEKLPKEADSILEYVAQLKDITSSMVENKVAGELRNVVREDNNPTETGVNTKNIVANMPNSQDDYLKVEKIL